MNSASELPLFPLRTVLFPGGELRLRVFEARYLDMVTQCGRSGSGFGVCLILDGEEVGRPATPAAFGTLARIVDFHADPDGLLGLQVRGECRFHVRRTRVRDNGLVIGDIGYHEDVIEAPGASARLRPEHALLAELLRRILEQVSSEHTDPDPALFEDAPWVGWRLAELLPLDLPERQRLMELDTPGARLDHLIQALSGMERLPR